MNNFTAMINAVCKSEGIDVGSVSGEVEGSHSDMPSDMECHVTVGTFTRCGLSSSVRKLEKSEVQVRSASTKFKVNLERFLW